MIALGHLGAFSMVYFESRLNNGSSANNNLQVSLRRTFQISGAKWPSIQKRKGPYYAFLGKET